jgi:hypothetical protein
MTPTAKLRLTAASLFAATAALAGVAAQAADPMSDVAFIAASRCEGLAQGAKVDDAAIKKLLVGQDSTRSQYVLDKASEVHDDAKRQASHAQGYQMQAVNDELHGPCSSYLKS